MAFKIDWERDIRAQAAQADVDLTDATVEEIAEHLDDIYAAARADGGSEQEALTRARGALEESTLEILRRAPTRTSASARRAPPAAGADAAVIQAGGTSLNLGGAVRLAVRHLRLRPGFAVITILVLALGIGSSTAVFSIVDSVLLRPLPYSEPDRLVTLWDTNARQGLLHEPISPVNFMDYRALPVFDGAAAWWRPSLNLVDPGLDPMRVNAIEVSGNFFDVLGIRPQIGQGFPPGGAFFVQREPLVVISDRLWRTRYNANPAIVGRPLVFNGIPHIVSGVMPPKFHYPDDIDVWQRLLWDLTQHTRAAHFMESVLRVKDGTTIEEAAVASQTLARRLATEFSRTNKDWDVTLVPLLDEQLGYYRPALLVLVGAVGLVLIIGCLNVASLLLTRALSREREIAVRIAMGASPRQIVAQLLTESLVLSCAGAAVGIITAIVALPALAGIAPAGIPRLDEAHVDVRALGVAIAIVATTTVIFGLVPAFVLLRNKVSVDLRSGERGSSRGARRAYTVIVAGQVALACTLLVSSALLIRTVVKMVETPTGVNADDVITTSVQLPGGGFAPGEFLKAVRAQSDIHALLLERIREQPGIISAGATNVLPLDIGWRLPFDIDGAPPVRADERRIAQYHTISDGYFEAMGARLVAGRSFTKFDTAAAPAVVVVNQTFASRYVNDGPAVGRLLLSNMRNVGPLGTNLMLQQGGPNQPVPPRAFEIVGVVTDVRNTPLGQPVEPAIFFGAQQFPFRELFYTVRATSANAATTAIRKALAATTPTVPMGVVRTWGDRMAARTAEPRMLMTLLIVFGATAALLAALGVYGLFSWSVAQRTRELAIRLTLGARPSSVGASVLRQSFVLIVVGLAAGFVIIRLAEATLARVLFEMSPRDPESLLAAGALLILVALAACVPPAIRALRVDPVEGLRVD